MEGISGCEWGRGAGEMEGFTFVRPEGHLPLCLPMLKGVEVSLKEFAVVVCLNGSIDEAVVSEESSSRVRSA